MTAEDREAIRTLIVGYARATDRARVDGLTTGDYFTEDATMEAPGRLEEGLATILRRQAADLLVDEPPAQHTVTGTTVALEDSGEAHAVSEFLCTELRPDGPVVVLAGRYVDTLVRRDGGWRIRHRRVQPLA